MEFTDTHCHIHFKKYGLDQQKVIDDAHAAGVKTMLAVGTTIADSELAIDFAQKHERIWASAGIHPHDSAQVEAHSTASKLSELIKHPKVVAVGEIGLDYYKNYAEAGQQQKALRLQIETTLESGLPYIFHVREAWSDFWKIFDDYKDLKGVIHSFSSDSSQVDQALSRGLLIGLNGIMTFTNDGAQLEAAKRLPLDKLLLETDAPFLTPKPYRGQICEPKHVVDTAKFLAELRGEELHVLASATTINAAQLFGWEE